MPKAPYISLRGGGAAKRFPFLGERLATVTMYYLANVGNTGSLQNVSDRRTMDYTVNVKAHRIF